MISVCDIILNLFVTQQILYNKMTLQYAQQYFRLMIVIIDLKTNLS